MRLKTSIAACVAPRRSFNSVPRRSSSASSPSRHRRRARSAAGARGPRSAPASAARARTASPAPPARPGRDRRPPAPAPGSRARSTRARRSGDRPATRAISIRRARRGRRVQVGKLAAVDLDQRPPGAALGVEVLEPPAGLACRVGSDSRIFSRLATALPVLAQLLGPQRGDAPVQRDALRRLLGRVRLPGQHLDEVAVSAPAPRSAPPAPPAPPGDRA